MKDFNEITSHVLAIDKADDEKAISFYVRKQNLEALACKVADELIAGRPVPVFNQAESITRIDGMLTQLANELVHQHDIAIAHRTHLAERLEADGGENGAKAAAILRGMNAVAQPVFFTGGYASKPDDMFVGAQALGGITALPGGARIGAPHLTAEDQAKRIEQAELRGFYLGRNKALGILFAERRKWEMGEEGDVRAVIARVSEAICYMQKEG